MIQPENEDDDWFIWWHIWQSAIIDGFAGSFVASNLFVGNLNLQFPIAFIAGFIGAMLSLLVIVTITKKKVPLWAIIGSVFFGFFGMIGALVYLLIVLTVHG